MLKKLILCTGVMLGTVTAGAVVPPEFAVMSDEIPAEIPAVPVNEPNGFFIHSKPDGAEEKLGWMFGRIGTEITGIPENKETGPFRVKRLEHFAAGGQYAVMAFVIQMQKEQKQWNLVLSELKNSSGGKIAPENLKLRRIASRRTFPVYSCDMLIRPELKSVKKGDVLHYLYLVNVPRGTAGGVYRGSIRISGDAGSSVIPVALHVFGYDLPEADGVFGTYIAGHFDVAGTGYARYSPKTFTPDQLEPMFRFWKTRRLNSPVFTHLLPEYETVDGKQEIAFRTLRLLADGMKRAGVKGPLCVDSRFWAWHAEALEKKTPGKSAEEHYKDRLRALIQTAEKEQWPALKLFPEEEVGNPDNTKKRTYARFWKPMREVAGGRDYIIDNDIGYNRANAVDRGNTDCFPVIQYNSWEDGALEKAHRNNREVWAYNYGFHRGSFGFLLARLGATGNHQWAEMWITNSKYYWQTLAFFKDGVCSGMNYEWMHEGISDYRYIQLLKKKIAELRNAGKNAEAKKMEALILQVSGDVPITSAGAGGWNANCREAELNRRRWLIALAVQEADRILSGKKDAGDRHEDTPVLKSTALPVKTEQFRDTANSIAVPLLEHPKLDGMPDLRGRNGTGPLRVRVSDEINARAYSSSEEEFRKRIACAWTEVWLTYNPEGLLISSIGNFGTPAASAKPKYGDGDGNLWRETCMEYFFQKPGDPIFYQLIVSNFDKKIMSGGGRASFKKIKVYSRQSVNSAGGLAQEVLIPWSEFGLKRMPEAGSVWKFNACRELQGYRNPLMTWGRVMTDFSEKDRWGTIVFTGKSGVSNIFDKVTYSSLYPGKNTVSGIMKPQRQKGVLRLTDSAGRVAAEEKISAGKAVNFAIRFDIPKTVSPGAWRLTFVEDGGKEAENVLLPVETGKPLTLTAENPGVVAGQVLFLSALVKISDASIRENPLEIVASSGDVRLSYPPLIFRRSGENHVWLTTDGMKPGNYLYVFRIGTHTEKIPVEILPAFASGTP